MQMTRLQLHVPLTLNDGRPTPLRDLLTIEHEMEMLTPGFFRHEVVGFWRSGNQSFRETQWVFTTDTHEAEVREAVLNLAAEACELLDQECVYVTEAPITQHFVTKEGSDA